MINNKLSRAEYLSNFDVLTKQCEHNQKIAKAQRQAEREAERDAAFEKKKAEERAERERKTAYIQAKADKKRAKKQAEWERLNPHIAADRREREWQREQALALKQQQQREAEAERRAAFAAAKAEKPFLRMVAKYHADLVRTADDNVSEASYDTQASRVEANPARDQFFAFMEQCAKKATN